MSKLVLAVDTCGAAGSVALARLIEASAGDSGIEPVGQKELAGRTYSTTLIPAIEELLNVAHARVADLHAIVAVSGPGSFTGVRVGLSTVKGLSEPGQTPVVTVSRLAVLARKGKAQWAALDAHRGEIFLRMAEGEPGNVFRERLAGQAELGAMSGPPGRVAVCDAVAGALIEGAWPGAELVRTSAPTALEALELAVPLVRSGEFVDLALLDGHYLRRSDAEIFGEKAAAGAGQR